MQKRTELEKMLSEEVYDCRDADLEARRQSVKNLLRMYNLAEDIQERTSILGRLLGSIGINSIVEAPFHCVYGQNIHIGDNVYLNVQATILDCAKVHIGNNVMVGPNVQIYTAAHLLQAEARNQGLEIAKPIVIEDNVWIGGGAILLPGVSIGQNAVVGAGAVVPKNVAPNMVVAGNPAKEVREIDQTQRI